MGGVTIFVYIYLIIGFIYGIYLLFTGSSTLWALPINILGGPMVVVYILYKTLRKEKIRYP